MTQLLKDLEKMMSAFDALQKRSEILKTDIRKKYEQILAKQLIKGAEQTADYRFQDSEPAEKWLIYFIEELESRLK